MAPIFFSYKSHEYLPFTFLTSLIHTPMDKWLHFYNLTKISLGIAFCQKMLTSIIHTCTTNQFVFKEDHLTINSHTRDIYQRRICIYILLFSIYQNYSNWFRVSSLCLPFFLELVMCTDLLSFEHALVLLFCFSLQGYFCIFCNFYLNLFHKTFHSWNYSHLCVTSIFVFCPQQTLPHLMLYFKLTVNARFFLSNPQQTHTIIINTAEKTFFLLILKRYLDINGTHILWQDAMWINHRSWPIPHLIIYIRVANVS